MRIPHPCLSALTGLAIVWTPSKLSAQPITPRLRIELPTTDGADELILGRFLFDGEPLAENQVRETLLSDGVREVTAEAPSIGEFEFAIQDLSNYYRFGERFDRLDHVHSILKNETRNTVGVKGNDTYKPVPFFMSLRGYGVWVDTFSVPIGDGGNPSPSGEEG